jgi:hypothetical protein
MRTRQLLAFEPRHVHAEYAETAAIVDLRVDRTVALADRPDRVRPANAKRSDVKKILETAQEHFDVLVAAWEAMHS